MVLAQRWHAGSRSDCAVLGPLSATADVEVSGAAVLAPDGSNLEQLWLTLQQQTPAGCLRHGRDCSSASAYAQQAGLLPSECSVLGLDQCMALAVVEQAWTQAGLSPQRQALRGETAMATPEPWRRRAGVFAGSALGAAGNFSGEWDQRPSPYSLTRWRGNGIGAAVGVRYGLMGQQVNLQSASATGGQLLAMAGAAVASGRLDLAVVVAAEPALTAPLLAACERSGALAPSGAGLPLAADRAGMRPAPMAGCIVLERADVLRARGGQSLGCWRGGDCANEAHHLLAPQPGGARMAELVRSLLETTQLVPGQIDWVALHATGTRRFDAEEMAMVRSLFQPLPWLTAFKRWLGHGLGAAGVVEAALLLQGLLLAQLPPWPEACDPDLQIGRAPAITRVPQRALQLSSGMGGVVAANLWEAR